MKDEPVGRRALLIRLLAGLGLAAVALPGRFWRVVRAEPGPGRGRRRGRAHTPRRARTFEPDELDRPHDLAG